MKPKHSLLLLCVDLLIAVVSFQLGRCWLVDVLRGDDFAERINLPLNETLAIMQARLNNKTTYVGVRA